MSGSCGRRANMASEARTAALPRFRAGDVAIGIGYAVLGATLVATRTGASTMGIGTTRLSPSQTS